MTGNSTEEPHLDGEPPAKPQPREGHPTVEDPRVQTVVDATREGISRGVEEGLKQADTNMVARGEVEPAIGLISK